MRVIVLYNPIAGAGRAAGAAREVRDALAGAEHDASLLETRLDPAPRWLEPELAEVDLLVVVGGDGAMRMAGATAGRTSTPVYHFPQGTENLFARGIGSDRSVPRLLAAMRRFEVERLDVGSANGRTFLLMASVGYDAEVVHDLASRRRGRISHFTYAGPMVRQLAGWKPPRLSIAVDGEEIVSGEPGCVVVANSRQYGGRFDPAVRASMTDGRLDVVFLPGRSRFALLRWMYLCRRRRHLEDPRVVYRLGTEIEVTCDPPRRYQLDGDPPEGPAEDLGEAGGDGDDGGAVGRLRISLRPNMLPTLMP